MNILIELFCYLWFLCRRGTFDHSRQPDTDTHDTDTDTDTRTNDTHPSIETVKCNVFFYSFQLYLMLRSACC